MSMILLEPQNRILQEAVSNLIKGDGARTICDVRLCDLDDVSYHVTVPDGGESMKVSIGAPCYSFIDEKGSHDALKEAFGDKLAGENDVEAGYHATVDINFADLGDDKAKDQLITDLGMIKPILIGGVFKQFFQALAKGEKSDPFNFPLRGDTKVYFFPGDGRVTVIFEVDFPIRVDAVVGQIFLQEFQDARRRLGAAPPCKFSQNPPQELAHFNITESGWDKKEGMRGYLSFAILSSHVSTPAKIENTVNTLQSFRNFLQYHIKCSKAYFHSRMRHQVRELLKVLRRAIVVDHSKIKRKADGTPFSR